MIIWTPYLMMNRLDITLHLKTLLYPIKTVEKLQHLEEIQPKITWKPLDVIMKTLKTTTQWEITKEYLPMRKHHVSRFPKSDRIRLKETVSKDTIFKCPRI